MKLITETVERVKYITEASEKGKKNLFIEGTFLVGDQVNKNNRMYKMDTLRKEVSRYTDEYINNNRALGELGHPDTPTLNLERVSHKIVSLVEDGNTFYGKALILMIFKSVFHLELLDLLYKQKKVITLFKMI
jgi:hypothetical protein